MCRSVLSTKTNICLPFLTPLINIVCLNKACFCSRNVFYNFCCCFLFLFLNPPLPSAHCPLSLTFFLFLLLTFTTTRLYPLFVFVLHFCVKSPEPKGSESQPTPVTNKETLGSHLTAERLGGSVQVLAAKMLTLLLALFCRLISKFMMLVSLCYFVIFFFFSRVLSSGSPSFTLTAHTLPASSALASLRLKSMSKRFYSL